MGPFIICELIGTTGKISIPIDSIRSIHDTEIDLEKSTTPCAQIDYDKNSWVMVQGNTEDITGRIHQKLQETYF